MGSDEAAQLASTGASAAGRRREMLATAAAGNGFGEQAWPGAYPPLNTFTVEFTTLLANQQAATFNGATPRARYLSLVVAQARLTGTSKTPTVSTVSISDRIVNGKPSGLFVRVKVAFVDRLGAQLFEFRLEQVPGPRPTWLTAPYGAGSFVLPTVKNSAMCTAALCKVCFNTPTKCASCFDTVGTVGTPQFRTVYKNTKGACVTCTPNCERCKANGMCEKCAPGHNINLKGQCIKATRCTVPNCNQCLPRPFANRCKLCKASVTVGKKVFSVYKSGGQCRMCTVPNCRTCNTSGKCIKCNRGPVDRNGKCKA